MRRRKELAKTLIRCLQTVDRGSVIRTRKWWISYKNE